MEVRIPSSYSNYELELCSCVRPITHPTQYASTTPGDDTTAAAAGPILRASRALNRTLGFISY
jgi:hypothetical protein